MGVYGIAVPAGTRFLADGTATAPACQWAPATKNQPGVVPTAQPPHDLPAGQLRMGGAGEPT